MKVGLKKNIAMMLSQQPVLYAKIEVTCNEYTRHKAANVSKNAASEYM